MKTVMIVIDGLSDEPIPQFDGKTPLESAFTPNIHYIANKGQIGRLQTTFPGYPIESMVCIMGLLGYAPEQYYPHGRSSFEAMAKGIPLHPSDLVLRCNTITVDLSQQILVDFTAGMISDSMARKLLSRIQLPYDNWELYPGQSYRNILIIRGEGVDARSIKCHEPHMHIGASISETLPIAMEDKALDIVAKLRSFLLDSQQQIENMDLSEDCSANMLWLWSPSIKPIWPSFFQRTGISAAFVGGLDFLHGIAMAAGIHFDIIPGATGYINTSYRAKAQYTIDYLLHYDFVLTHINAADEESHQKNPLGKRDAIERIDHQIVGPVLWHLINQYPDEFRIVICGDHATSSLSGKHLASPVPYAIFGKNFTNRTHACFGETKCSNEEPTSSLHYLANFLLKDDDNGHI